MTDHPTERRLGRRPLALATSKAASVLLSVVGAGLTLVAASRVWATGSVVDPLVGQGAVSATGGELAKGVVALAIVVAAAGLAGATSGRTGRIVAVVVGALAVVGAALLTVRVALDPGEALGPVAAAAVGRAGALPVRGTVTAWPWVALAGLAVAALGWLGMVRGLRHWRALSGRYDAPGSPGMVSRGGVPTASGEGAPAGRRAGQAPAAHPPSDWDALSSGLDPTDLPTDPAPDDRT